MKERVNADLQAFKRIGAVCRPIEKVRLERNVAGTVCGSQDAGARLRMADADPAPGSGPPPPSHSALTPAEARLIVYGVLLAMLIAALDQTIVSTALPTIGRELGDAHQLTWVVTAYLLASTVVTPLYGKLSDSYGRRVTLLVAVGVFVAGSVACALSPTMLILIIARTFQGLGGGGLISLSQTIIGDIIPPKERPRYQAYVSGVFVVASLAGPLLGGFIAEHLHWSLIFWINPPIGLLALGLIYSLLRKLPVSRRHHQIDFAGAGLLVVATVALMLALSWGGVRYPWASPHILALVVAFAIFAALFFMRQRRAAEPLAPVFSAGQRGGADRDPCLRARHGNSDRFDHLHADLFRIGARVQPHAIGCGTDSADDRNGDRRRHRRPPDG